jgi:hypothetical protein
MTTNDYRVTGFAKFAHGFSRFPFDIDRVMGAADE